MKNHKLKPRPIKKTHLVVPMASVKTQQNHYHGKHGKNSLYSKESNIGKNKHRKTTHESYENNKKKKQKGTTKTVALRCSSFWISDGALTSSLEISSKASASLGEAKGSTGFGSASVGLGTPTPGAFFIEGQSEIGKSFLE